MAADPAVLGGGGAAPGGGYGWAADWLVEDEDGDEQQQRDPHDHCCPDAEDLGAGPGDGRQAVALRAGRIEQVVELVHVRRLPQWLNRHGRAADPAVPGRVDCRSASELIVPPVAAIPTRTRDAGIFGWFPGTHSPLDFGVGFPSAARFIVLPVSDFLALSPGAGAFGWFRGPLPLLAAIGFG